jgi:cell division protein FtsZ
MIQFDLPKDKSSIIKVIGVGGGGSNAVNHMYAQHIEGVDFIICNTDAQALATSEVPNKIQLGPSLTRGLGAGANPKIGREATEESLEEIRRILEVNTDMAFITAGMGGGTGTGAAPVVASIAKEMKCLVVGVVTLPFSFEGKRRMDNALAGMEQLRKYVDTLITIRNDSIFQVVDRKTPIDQAFRVIDDILLNGVRGISDIINNPGIINVDFADVKAIMKDTGDAIMGIGEGAGENRVTDAVDQAINNVLLEESSIEGASSLLINVSGGKDLSINDWNEVSQIITSQVDSNANIIIGLNEDENLQDRIRVTVIATGFKRISHIMPANLRREPIRDNKESDVKPVTKVVNIIENESTESSRAMKPPPKQQTGYNYNEDYDIPTYLRRRGE